MQNPSNEQIQLVIQQDDLSVALAELSGLINREEFGIEINSSAIFCQKTGKKIGIRDENSLLDFVKIHGKQNLAQLLYNSTCLAVAPIWIATNGPALDKLLEDDPIGYAVYCFGIITAQFYQNTRPVPQDRRKIAYCEQYWALARAHEIMAQRGAAQLTELNQHLCKILTFMPDTGDYLFRRIREFSRTPDKLAMLHCSGELIQILRETTNRAVESIGHADRWIKRTRFIDISATAEHMARGPSNIRKQRQSASAVKEASMQFELQKLFEDAGLDLGTVVLNNTPGSTAWRQKYMSEAQLREQDIIADLKELAEITNLAFGEDENEEIEDNTVEISQLVRLPSPVGEQTSDNGAASEPEPNQSIIPQNMIDNAMNEIANSVESFVYNKSQGMTYEEVAKLPPYEPIQQTKPLSLIERMKLAKRGE